MSFERRAMSFEQSELARRSLLVAHDLNGIILANRTSRRRGSESARKNAPLEKAGHGKQEFIVALGAMSPRTCDPEGTQERDDKSKES